MATDSEFGGLENRVDIADAQIANITSALSVIDGRTEDFGKRLTAIEEAMADGAKWRADQTLAMKKQDVSLAKIESLAEISAAVSAGWSGLSRFVGRISSGIAWVARKTRPIWMYLAAVAGALTYAHQFWQDIKTWLK